MTRRGRARSGVCRIGGGEADTRSEAGGPSPGLVVPLGPARPPTLLCWSLPASPVSGASPGVGQAPKAPVQRVRRDATTQPGTPSGNPVQLAREKRQAGWRACEVPERRTARVVAAWEMDSQKRTEGSARREKGRLGLQSLEQAARTFLSPPSPSHLSVLH